MTVILSELLGFPMSWPRRSRPRQPATTSYLNENALRSAYCDRRDGGAFTLRPSSMMAGQGRNSEE